MRAGADPPCRQADTAVTRSAVLKQLGVVAGAGVVAAGATFGGPLPALADNSLAATKRSYFRYVPRILVRRGRGAWCTIVVRTVNETPGTQDSVGVYCTLQQVSRTVLYSRNSRIGIFCKLLSSTWVRWYDVLFFEQKRRRYVLVSFVFWGRGDLGRRSYHRIAPSRPKAILVFFWPFFQLETLVRS